MPDIDHYLETAVRDGASDLFVSPGSPVREKIGRDVTPMDEEKLSAEAASSLVAAIYGKAGRPMQQLERHGDDDFSFAVPGLARFRVNAYRQRGTIAAVLRAVAFDIPDYKAIGIPEDVMAVAEAESGLVVVTGAAGSGKSTTMACCIDRINHTKRRHVVTLEDPIEYLHRNDMSLVTQREIALDSDTYLTALRACLRQAPDVICLAEMRDPETIRTAITAAETGHLVLGTLHTKGAANAVDRIIDSFPPEQQQQIRAQLAMVLNCVVSQQLVPGVDGPVALFEVMKATNNVRSLIRDSRTHQLDNAISSGGRDGMVSMEKAAANAVRAGRITVDAALQAVPDPEKFKKTAGIG